MTATPLPKPSTPSPLAESSTPSDHDPRGRTPSLSPPLEDDDATSRISEDYYREWLGSGRPGRGASRYGPMDDEYHSDEETLFSFNDDYPRALGSFSASIFDDTPWAAEILAAGGDDALKTYVTIALKQLDDENHFPTLFIRFLLRYCLEDLARALDLSKDEALFAHAANVVLPTPSATLPEPNPKPEPEPNEPSIGKAPTQPEPSAAAISNEKDKCLLREALNYLVARLDLLSHADSDLTAPRFSQVWSQTIDHTSNPWLRVQEYAAHIAYLGLLAHNEMKARKLTAAQMDAHLQTVAAPLGDYLAGFAGTPLRQILIAAATGWTAAEYRALLAEDDNGGSGIALAALRRGAGEAKKFVAGK